MSDPISRRDLIKGLGVAGASGLLTTASANESASSEVNRPVSQLIITKAKERAGIS